MLAGRWPGWLLLLAAASSAGVFAVPPAGAQTRPVSPTTRPTTVAPSVARPAVEPTVQLARGCAPLPDLAGKALEDVLPKLSPELFRPRVNKESSSQPRGTILRQPTTQLIEGRLCWLDITVSNGSLTRVPRLTGATADEAARSLAKADLGIAIREKSSDEPAGRVFAQRPDAGDEVPRQSTVVAIVATATERVRASDRAAAAAAAAIAAAARDVPSRLPPPEPAEETCLLLPDLAGQHVDDVLPTLGRRYFRPRLSREPSTEPPGTILRQPATVPIDGSLCYVDIAVSDGSLTQVPELFDVPAVVGLPYREAARQLERFTVTRDVAASRLPSGQVIDQDPRPPAQRPVGAEVRVKVSDGSLVLVPPVERGTLESARAALGEFELRTEVEELEGDLAPGLIATQEPGAGAEVSRGSIVRLAVSTGLTVPDVMGRQIADAATLLGRFEVQQSTVQGREPEGQVIDQEPRPPARVAAGTVVRVDLSDGSRVLVPPVEGAALASARGALDGADLQAEVVEQEGELAAGLVATQDPSAGTEVSRGSTVRIVVSTGLPVPDVDNTPPMPPVMDAPIEPPAEGTGAVVRNDGDEPAWPGWLPYVVALLAGSGLFHAVRLRLRPPPPAPHVSARVESDLGSVEVTDVGLVGPEIHVSARLDAGDCDIRLEGDSS